MKYQNILKSRYVCLRRNLSTFLLKTRQKYVNGARNLNLIERKDKIIFLTALTPHFIFRKRDLE